MNVSRSRSIPHDELAQVEAELAEFARRLRRIADREAHLPALRAAECVDAAARELGVDLRQ